LKEGARQEKVLCLEKEEDREPSPVLYGESYGIKSKEKSKIKEENRPYHPCRRHPFVDHWMGDLLCKYIQRKL